MADVEFIDNSIQVKQAMDDIIKGWLYEAAGEIQSQAARNTHVDSGQTKGSWEYMVDEKNSVAYVGSSYDNAIWEEFGTGIYALNGDGRTDVPWKYKDVKGNWHSTKGKKPRRMLWKSFTSVKGKAKQALAAALKEI